MTSISFLHRASILAAWALAGFIVYATWGPQGLRPHMTADPQLERFGAYFVTAATFVVAYPRRPRLIALIAVTAAIVLELGQLVAPGRDAGVPDAIAKACGGLAGAAAIGIVLSVWRRSRRVSAP